MTLNVRRRGYALGAEVTGIDATKPIDDATIAEVNRALLEHIVLVFPGQNLEPQQLRDFCGRFGEFDTVNTGRGSTPANVHQAVPEVVVRTNKAVVLDGKVQAKSYAADAWHTDFSYRERPSTLTFLLGKQIPSVGGDTMFSNLYTAFDTLSPALQRLLEPLEAVHDFSLGPTYARLSPEEKQKSSERNPPVIQRVVRPHPVTGRKALYVADRIRNFVGMTEEESKPLLAFLQGHATRYEFVYRHRWTVHDLVVWDNQCALHYAVQDFDQSEIRSMMRCSLVGPKTGRMVGEAPAGHVPAAVSRLN